MEYNNIVYATLFIIIYIIIYLILNILNIKSIFILLSTLYLHYITSIKY